MSTYREMQDEVLEHQLNDTKYRPSVMRWLNEAQNRIARQVTLRALYTKIEYPWAAGSNQAALPDDYARKVEIADSSDDDAWRLLFPMELHEFDALSEAAAAPRQYVITGNLLYLYPTPDANVEITISYQRLPAAMTDDADEPEIPPDYHYLLPYWTLYRCFMRENDIEQATAWKNEWLGELEKLKGEAHYEGQDFPRQIPGDFVEGPLVGPNDWY